jgi:hypothetical protein
MKFRGSSKLRSSNAVRRRGGAVSFFQRLATAAAISTALLGSIVQHVGEVTDFLLLASASAIALVAAGRLLKETKPDKYDD